ncbi:hypothetical protein OV208_36615 [Corallococcus sp. bb12-1]|uniref:hypothetical protein n=1 Tax=Corallococcus sp. bb12-1 TaxID=2996784 RepID=UPI0022720569|nr:hypothetical protein [Corallococcus sp. bb12-1]MCY1046886.1 hypothetical protein [Corallococcus sp. bb12-1]
MAQEKKRDALSEAIAKLDWHGCSATLATLNAGVDYLLERIIHSGSMILQRGDDRLRQRRDTFASGVEAHLTTLGATDELQAFIDHVRQCKLAESGYQAIQATLQETTGDIAPDQHAWGTLERLHLELLALKKNLRRELRKRKTVDPVSLHLVGDDGATYAPDAAAATFISTASAAVKMFAYGNRWFDGEGNIVLPARPFVSARTRWRIGNTFVLGAAWRTLDFSTERWRFFGGEVRILKEAGGSAERLPRDVLDFRVDSLRLELLEDIAGQRLDRLLMQASADLPAMRFRKGDPSTHAPLPPVAFIDEEEVLAVLGLSQILHFPVPEDLEEYEGLRLIEWIRGYLCLKGFVDGRRAVRGVVRFSSAEFIAVAVGYDLSASKATMFLELLKFGRDTIDLFDAPLLAGVDGFIYAVREVVLAANVPRVVLSQLSGLGVQIGWKGRALEKAVRERIQRQGIRCVGFKFKIDGVDYDCDAAFVWDRVLFLFECKNRSYSSHKPSRLYGFLSELGEGMTQAERMAEHFAKHPDAVRQHLGVDLQWDRIVPCVVNGIPFSIGKVEGIYVYDASALARFFESKRLNVVAFSAGDKTSMPFSIPEATLWAGEQPTAEDLVRQMNDPAQISMLRPQFTEDVRWGMASNELMIAAPTIRSMETPLDPGLVSALEAHPFKHLS